MGDTRHMYGKLTKIIIVKQPYLIKVCMTVIFYFMKPLVIMSHVTNFLWLHTCSKQNSLFSSFCTLTQCSSSSSHHYHSLMKTVVLLNLSPCVYAWEIKCSISPVMFAMHAIDHKYKKYLGKINVKCSVVIKSISDVH